MKIRRWQELGVQIDALLGRPALRAKTGGWMHDDATCQYWHGGGQAEERVPVDLDADLCMKCWEENEDLKELIAEGWALERVLDEYYEAEEEGFSTGGFKELYHVVQTLTHRDAQRTWAQPLKEKALGEYHASYPGGREAAQRESLAAHLRGAPASGEEVLLYVPNPGSHRALGALYRDEAPLASAWWCENTRAPGLLLQAPEEIAAYLEVRLRYLNSDRDDTRITPSIAALETDDTAATIELAAALLDQESETFSSIQRALEAARALQHQPQEIP